MKENPKTKGFTLIETLVAISVLLTAVVAPLTIAARSISYTNFARDQIIASYLAFDALETIIAMRDYNVANKDAWDSRISCFSGTCRIDTSYEDIDDINVENCVENDSNPNFDPATTCYLSVYSNGFYGYGDNRRDLGSRTPTPFKRIIDIENIPGTSDEKLVVSRVKFKTGILTREFTFKLNLFNTGV